MCCKKYTTANLSKAFRVRPYFSAKASSFFASFSKIASPILRQGIILSSCLLLCLLPLLSFVNPKIPIYLSQGCKELITISHYFGQTDCDPKNVEAVTMWQPFKKGNFTITPYLVDHSGFDALAFLIESEGKKIFYSGDFRGHGRKSILFDNILKKPPRGIVIQHG